MNWKDKLRNAANDFLREEKRSEHVPPHVHRTGPRRLTDEDKSDFLKAAGMRDNAGVWDQLQALLDDLYLESPLRVSRMKRDLRWLRREAKKHGVVIRG